MVAVAGRVEGGGEGGGGGGGGGRGPDLVPVLRVEVLDGEQHQPVRRGLLSAAHEVGHLPDAVDVRAELVAREVERDVGAPKLTRELEVGIVEALRLVRVAVQPHAELGRHGDRGGG